MIIIFIIFLATVVTNSQEKHIELLSNEEFLDKLTRRAGGGDSNSEESRISNRDDKSYIPDIDWALTDIYARRYSATRQENSADYDINLTEINETTLPLHEGPVTIDDNNNNVKEGEDMDQDKNTPDSQTPKQYSDEEPNVSPENNTLKPEKPIRVSDYEHSDTENIIEENTANLSTTLAETSVILSITGTNSNNKSTTDKEAQAPEYDSEVHVPENESSVNNYETSSKATESYINDSNDGTITYESTTDSVLDITTKENADVFDILDSQKHTTTIENTAQVSTTKDYIAVIENSLTNENLETIMETTTFIPALMASIEKDQRLKKPINITNTIIHAVNEIESKTKSEQCKYCYRVYELLWPIEAGNQSFFRSQKSINPKNHLGPNEVEVDNRQNRIVNNDIQDIADVSELITEFNNESRKFVVFKQKNESPNTLDEFTIHYGRQGSNRKKTKKKKRVRIFDDTNKDILPELMHAMLGSESVDVPIIDTYKDLADMDKHARLDLLDYVSVRDSTAKFEDMTIRKRSNDESTINIHMNVLKDLILEDSKALKQYDWLTTTVQIQSALTKILKVINRVKQSEPIHPADLQILKYLVFLHYFSLVVKEVNKLDNKLTRRLRLLHKNKKKNKLLKKTGLINRAWLHYKPLLRDMVEEDEFSHLYEFLIDVQDGLIGLHKAIRHIADVTKFDGQNWYGHLKQLYLSEDEKQLRELLLHISMSRLIDLVENSCKQGIDNDVIFFLQNHEKEAKLIVKELLFIGKIVDELKINMK